MCSQHRCMCNANRSMCSANQLWFTARRDTCRATITITRTIAAIIHGQRCRLDSALGITLAIMVLAITLVDTIYSATTVATLGTVSAGIMEVVITLGILGDTD